MKKAISIVLMSLSFAAMANPSLDQTIDGAVNLGARYVNSKVAEAKTYIDQGKNLVEQGRTSIDSTVLSATQITDAAVPGAGGTTYVNGKRVAGGEKMWLRCKNPVEPNACRRKGKDISLGQFVYQETGLKKFVITHLWYERSSDNIIVYYSTY